MDKMDTAGTECTVSTRTASWHSGALIRKESGTGVTQSGTNLWLEAISQDFLERPIGSTGTDALLSSAKHREVTAESVGRVYR